MSAFLGLIPTPGPIQPQSRVYDLKARLDWGEPALTIVDVRDRQDFNACHITGAVSIPLDNLVAQSSSNFEVDRDIYVYGETDDETAIAATTLRDAGYTHVSELRGGLAAWKAVSYPIEVTTPAA
ncbi:MAG: rhodanese-like domain-containing protein [Elainellaceae cyanobacterium]